jgi:hypothetical protein
MADPKNKNFTIKPEIKADNRLSEIFVRMGVFTREELSTLKSTLKDSEENVVSVSIEDIIKAH